MILCAGVVSAMLLVLWACVAVNAWHFGRRRPMPAGKVLPMTMIKPVKGLDDALVAGLESIVASDPERALELIVAIESEDDPAYPAARAFAARHQDRDVKVLITGPSRGRMGKAHNMIEAYRAAKHPRVIFSDADTEATDGLVRRTSEAFTQGYEAVFALPFHRRAPGPGGFLFQVAFNHGFGVGAALSWYLGAFRFAAGAWMAYTKEAIDRSGGLEPVAHAIADDFAISVRARRRGAREAARRVRLSPGDGHAPLGVSRPRRQVVRHHPLERAVLGLRRGAARQPARLVAGALVVERRLVIRLDVFWGGDGVASARGARAGRLRGQGAHAPLAISAPRARRRRRRRVLAVGLPLDDRVARKKVPTPSGRTVESDRVTPLTPCLRRSSS